MNAKGFLCINKLRGGDIIKKAAVHNRREKPDSIETIDRSRTHLNYSIEGPATAQEVDQLARRLMAEAGITRERKNGVLGLELVFSLPRGFQCDERQFFKDCVDWAKRYFGCPLLSADVHNDQSQRHCHVILLPLVDGAMRGRQLVGMKADLFAMQKQFHEVVASRHGLKRVAKLSGAEKERAVNKVLAYYHQTSDSVLQSASWETIRRSIQAIPEDYLEDLGLELEKKPIKPFVEFVVSTGKGPRKEAERRVISQTAITVLGVPKQSDQNAITVLEAPAGSQQTAVAFRETEAKNQTVTSVLTVSNSAPISKPAIPRHEVDEDGVIHGLDAEPKAMCRPAVSTRDPACHGTYRRLTANPVGLFANLPGLARSTEPQWPAFLPRPHLAEVNPQGPKVIHPAEPDTPTSGADLSHLTTTRVKDTEQDAGTWNETLGEFVPAPVATGNQKLATGNRPNQHVTRTKAPAVATVPSDSYVEREDVYQPDFQDYEVQAWQD